MDKFIFTLDRWPNASVTIRSDSETQAFEEMTIIFGDDGWGYSHQV